MVVSVLRSDLQSSVNHADFYDSPIAKALVVLYLVKVFIFDSIVLILAVCTHGDRFLNERFIMFLE